MVAPDDTPAGEIERAVAEATAREVPSRFPATWTTGRLWVRLGLEGALVPVWRQELRLLLERVVSLLGNTPRL